MQTKSAARIAWSMCAVTIGVAVAYAVFLYLNRPTRLPGVVVSAVQTLPFVIAVPVIGALVASRRKENPVGWALLVFPLILALSAFAEQYAVFGRLTSPGSLPGTRFAAWTQTWLLVLFFPLPLSVLFLVLPDGKLPSRRWRPVVWVVLALTLVAALSLIFTPGDLVASCCNVSLRTTNPFGISRVHTVLGLVVVLYYLSVVIVLPLAFVGLFKKWRRADGELRQQLKWLVYMVALAAFAFIVALVVTAATGFNKNVNNTAFNVAIFAVALGVPAAAGMSILKYRLYDIDVVINKTLMYGVLAAFFTAIYVAIVVGIGAAVGSTSNRFLTIVAAVIIAVAFQPVRERARKFANRLVYGKRATPYEVLSEFSERLAGAYSTEDVLPRLARMLVSATGAQRATVWLRVGGELQLAAAWPEGGDAEGVVMLPPSGDELPEVPGEPLAFPVRHQGELLGALTVRVPSGETLGPTQENLLRDLSSQAGLMLRNVRLIAELRASRQRLVAAQDEERRRLERNIHDGAQQQLVAIAMKLGLARTVVKLDTAKADALLSELQAGVQESLEDLRDLARGIYPPLLADRGLMEALQSQVRKGQVPVEIEGDGIGRFPQETEAAVYFCCLEALQNIAKYATASRAQIRFTRQDGTLVFSVGDDGSGFDAAGTPRGSGLQNMEDRLAALGGTLVIRSSPGTGTTLTGTVPLGPTMAVRPDAPVSSPTLETAT